jgi:hypothetical protein
MSTYLGKSVPAAGSSSFDRIQQKDVWEKDSSSVTIFHNY